MRIGILLLSLVFSVSTLAQTTILFIGDSLGAAYGIDASESWVELIRVRLSETCSPPPVLINASISGDRTENALARLPQLLKEHQPQLVWIEMGSNDGLRGTNLNQLRDSLKQLIDLSQASGAKVALFDLMLPPNFGKAYTQGFNDVFENLAKEYKIPLIPYLLTPVAQDSKYILPDNLHPNGLAQPLIADFLWPSLKQTTGC